MEDERDEFNDLPGKYVFQVRLDDLELDARLSHTKPYSSLSNKGLLNCTNLVLYTLGIVKSEEYIKTCTIRKTHTSYRETLEYISDALRECNKPSKVEFSPDFGIRHLNKLTDALLPGYATELSLRKWGSDTGHDIIIRRDLCSRIFCIDPQQGTPYIYPEVVSGDEQVKQYLERMGWERWACIFSEFDGIIHYEEHEGCHTKKRPPEVKGARRKKTYRKKKLRRQTRKRR